MRSKDWGKVNPNHQLITDNQQSIDLIMWEPLQVNTRHCCARNSSATATSALPVVALRTCCRPAAAAAAQQSRAGQAAQAPSSSLASGLARVAVMDEHNVHHFWGSSPAVDLMQHADAITTSGSTSVLQARVNGARRFVYSAGVASAVLIDQKMHSCCSTGHASCPTQAVPGHSSRTGPRYH